MPECGRLGRVTLPVKEAVLTADDAGSCCHETADRIRYCLSHRLAAGARFGHDHQVFELQEVLKLRSLGLIQRVPFGEIQEAGNAGLRLFRRTERVDLLGRFAGHNKVDDFVAGSCREHDHLYIILIRCHTEPAPRRPEVGEPYAGLGSPRPPITLPPDRFRRLLRRAVSACSRETLAEADGFDL